MQSSSLLLKGAWEPWFFPLNYQVINDQLCISVRSAVRATYLVSCSKLISTSPLEPQSQCKWSQLKIFSAEGQSSKLSHFFQTRLALEKLLFFKKQSIGCFLLEKHGYRKCICTLKEIREEKWKAEFFPLNEKRIYVSTSAFYSLHKCIVCLIKKIFPSYLILKYVCTMSLLP